MIVHALLLSGVVATLATAGVAVVGTWVGWRLSRGRFRGRHLLEAVLSLPLVLPPTVTGYLLIVVLGRHGLLGGPLYRLTGFAVPFTMAACIAAAAVVAFPLMLRSARAAFDQIDRRHELAAATLGCPPGLVFRRVALPLARRGLIAGVVLTFGRALGEFGATLMLAGNIPGRTQTLPLAIYDAVLQGRDLRAAWLAGLLTLVSLIVMVVAGRMSEARR